MIKGENKEDKEQLSYNQEALWFIDQLEGSLHYHIPWIFKIEGDLNASYLEESIRKVIERHTILRTIINEIDGIGYQSIQSEKNWKLITKRVESLNEAHCLLERSLDEPFNLQEDYMLRAYLISYSDEKHILSLVAHHIAADGWSWNIIAKEISINYDGLLNVTNSDLSELEYQYSDYARWQREYIEGKKLLKGLDYWSRTLSEITPIRFRKPTLELLFEEKYGGNYRVELNKNLIKDIQNICASENVTPFIFNLTVLKILLYRYFNQNDICIGSPYNGRDTYGTEEIIGFFVNTIILRSTINGDKKFKDLLNDVKNSVIDSFEFGYVPFEKVVQEVQPLRELNSNPFTQIIFAYEDLSSKDELVLGKTKIEGYNQYLNRSKFDLVFTIQKANDQHFLNIEYNSNLFDRQLIAQFSCHFFNILESACLESDKEIKDINIHNSEDRLALMETAGIDELSSVNLTLVDLFYSSLRKDPDKKAVIFENNSFTYRELDDLSTSLSLFLQQEGVEKGHLVGICCKRSHWVAVGMMAILKAGAAFVPIDKDYPISRIEYITKDTRCKIVLTDESCDEILSKIYTGAIVYINMPNQWKEHSNLSIDSDQIPSCNDLAYVLYTSGSTGSPKGVMVEHGNVIALLSAFDNICESDESQIGMSLCPFVFDVSIWEVFVNLGFGKTLHILPEEFLFDANLITNYIIKNRIDTAYLPPTLLEPIISNFIEFGNFLPIKRLLVGVMPIKEFVLQKLLEIGSSIQIINGYGPTETTICATFYKVAKHTTNLERFVPVGKPVLGSKV
ncbi:non-ribosomal peptide synthetase, partial [Sphingobacterium sp. UBA7253]